MVRFISPFSENTMIQIERTIGSNSLLSDDMEFKWFVWNSLVFFEIMKAQMCKSLWEDGDSLSLVLRISLLILSEGLFEGNILQ